MMFDAKPWWYSRTIWGGIAAVIAGIGQEVGIPMSSEEVSALGESLFSVMTVIGGILAIYGRVRAERTIK